MFEGALDTGESHHDLTNDRSEGGSGSKRPAACKRPAAERGDDDLGNVVLGGAASFAAGVVIRAIIFATSPVSTSSSHAPDPIVVAEVLAD